VCVCVCVCVWACSVCVCMYVCMYVCVCMCMCMCMCMPPFFFTRHLPPFPSPLAWFGSALKVRVTDTGMENLTWCPRTVADVEAVCAGRITSRHELFRKFK
jgi:hypothetical protein